ncbi:hypothetical protein L2E82_47406 [Cichorium intybus]|uniref:Uncharacterized protein n=1 Tax=Cichorium intybus TaxID=13427 RepID=A0ACB8YVQ2_CICIN|nr:hypothetical protein L2E82_47406 [Cichorium intybus]
MLFKSVKTRRNSFYSPASGLSLKPYVNAASSLAIKSSDNLHLLSSPLAIAAVGNTASPPFAEKESTLVSKKGENGFIP